VRASPLFPATPSIIHISPTCTMPILCSTHVFISSPQDLRLVLKRAGLEGRDTVFLFTDTQIIQESMLEDINNLLNAGEVRSIALANCERHIAMNTSWVELMWSCRCQTFGASMIWSKLQQACGR
jgi:hypothetical protein